MLKRTFFVNQLTACFMITVMCAVIGTSSGCGRVGTKGLQECSKFIVKRQPPPTQMQPYRTLTSQRPQQLIPAFEIPVTGQGTPVFLPTQQQQPLIRSFDLPVACQGTARPAANARSTRATHDKDDWVADVLDTIANVVPDGQREDRQGRAPQIEIR